MAIDQYHVVLVSLINQVAIACYKKLIPDEQT